MNSVSRSRFGISWIWRSSLEYFSVDQIDLNLVSLYLDLICSRFFYCELIIFWIWISRLYAVIIVGLVDLDLVALDLEIVI